MRREKVKRKEREEKFVLERRKEGRKREREGKGERLKNRTRKGKREY